MTSPANSTDAKTTLIANPIAKPTATCCTTAPNAPGLLSPIMGISGNAAWQPRETKKANAILARAGKARDENTGAAVNIASTRKKGQKIGDSQAASCASEMEITH